MLEDDPVQSALKRAIATTIDQPRPVAKRPGRALDAHRLVCLRDHREDRRRLVGVQEESELLASSLPQLDDTFEGAVVGVAPELVQDLVVAPGADDVDAVVRDTLRVRRWLSQQVVTLETETAELVRSAKCSDRATHVFATELQRRQHNAAATSALDALGRRDGGPAEVAHGAQAPRTGQGDDRASLQEPCGIPAVLRPRPCTSTAPNVRTCIRPSKSEGADAGIHALSPAVDHLQRHRCRKACKIEVPIRLAQVQVRRCCSVHKQQADSAEANCPGAEFQMADERLCGTKHVGDLPPARIMRKPRRAHLDRVPQCSSRSVALGNADLTRLQACLPQRRLEASRLRRSARSCD
mmetsp:Transcript_53333/g.173432  ORF Transcript_53333/g.173432 Transcript_53333/m.173432 type:complete len:353 (-) Transcript_53333:170-1228(-)